MRSSDALPVRMSRIAVVAPERRLRDALVTLACAGTVELAGPVPPPAGEAAEALRRLDRRRGVSRDGRARLLVARPDPAALEQAGARDTLAGEVELDRRRAMAVRHGSFAALVGWTPTATLPDLDERLARTGAAAVELPPPARSDPPTLLADTRALRPFRPLVTTYGVARYANVDPTPFAAVAFVVMFAIMFGDVGHGLVLAALGLLLRRVRHGRLAPFQHVWPLVTAAGLAAAAVGLLYGEAFGPTGVVPRLWLDPVDDPMPLLELALVVGFVLLLVSHGFGVVNRYREAGARAAIVSPSGVAGLLVLLAAPIVVAGLAWSRPPALCAGVALAATGIVLLGVGFAAAAGGSGLGAAVAETSVELFDAVVRVGANLVSFARLAAFGVMHSALGLMVFTAAAALWGGVAGAVAAVLAFVLGNALAFSLELLVTGVQALRLEFYELYSRIFSGEGHPFAPWSLPVVTPSEEP